jgi:hypothetical protein
MRSEAWLGAAAVRYVSVRPGFRGPCEPRTEARTATDGMAGAVC